MKTPAAVLVELGRPLQLVELETPTLGEGQVLVEVGASGACHTQILEARGRRGEDKLLPHCLGHEAVGVVRETGPGVRRFKADDQVVLTWIKGSGVDAGGARYSHPALGQVNAGPVTTFQRHTVVSENRLQPLPEGVTGPVAVLLGCALPTGFGAVVRSGKARAGESFVLFGAGGVGLSALAAARAAGCTPRVAVDLSASKLAVAEKLGATHTIDVSNVDVDVALRTIAPHGFDLAVEATGVAAVMAQAHASVRAQGGRAVILGNAPHGTTCQVNPHLFNQGKNLIGSWGGDARPDEDVPRLGRLLSGELADLAELASKTYSLETINDALDDLEGGRVVRPVIDMALTA